MAREKGMGKSSEREERTVDDAGWHQRQAVLPVDAIDLNKETRPRIEDGFYFLLVLRD